jgi:AraC-like DNA-binding protein
MHNQIRVILSFIQVGFGVYYSTHQITLFDTRKPLKNVDSYSDSLDHGTSIIHGLQQKDSVLEFSYTLKNTLKFPYVALGLDLKQLTIGEDHLDLSTYQFLTIVIRSSKASGVTTQFKNYIPSTKQKNPRESFRLSQQDILLSQQWQDITIALQNYVVPDWWKTTYGNISGDTDLFFETATRFELAPSKSHFILPDQIDTLFIRSIRVSGKQNKAYYLALLLILAIWIPFIYQQINVFFRKKVLREVTLISYEKRPQPNSNKDDWTLISDYISINYHDSNINSSTIANNLSLSTKRINDCVKANMQSTLKVYLNDLRMREAIRLLSETELQVNQIAYDIGYNTVSHFNRVFKSYKNISPSEFRKANKVS